MKNLCTMHSNVLKSNPFISISIFYRWKPFYVVQPSLGKTETCGCIKCMNPILSIIQSKGMTPKMIIHLL